jgi:ankyrin repeat protein
MNAKKMMKLATIVICLIHAGETIQAASDTQKDYPTNPLIAAAGQGNLEEVKRLLDQGADPNAAYGPHWTALIFAAFNGHNKIVEALINAGAKIDHVGTHGRTALMFAAQEGHKDAFRTLLLAGADTTLKDTNNRTAEDIARRGEYHNLAGMIHTQILIEAIKNNQPEKIPNTLTRGADIALGLKLAAHHGRKKNSSRFS